MTQGMLTDNGRDPGLDQRSDRVEELRTLLEQARHNLVRLLADVPTAPRRLRVQAGDIVVEVEWDEQSRPGPAPSGTGVATQGAPVAAGYGAEAWAGSVAHAGADAGSGAGTGAGTGVGAADTTCEYLTAPTVGVFYRAQPGAAPFVAEGDLVRPGQQVGIVEAMKLMIPVEADRAGQVTEVLIGDGEPVEYGARLFALSAMVG